MKFLRLIITIPASLLRLFPKRSPLLQPSSPVEMSEKRKEIYTVMRIKIHWRIWYWRDKYAHDAKFLTPHELKFSFLGMKGLR